MNIGKLLGVALIFLGVVSGIAVYGITGAAIGNNGPMGLFWIISSVVLIMGIVVLLTSFEKDDTKHEKIDSLQVFSENERTY
jgi:uncharacterized membrane protein